MTNPTKVRNIVSIDVRTAFCVFYRDVEDLWGYDRMDELRLSNAADRLVDTILWATERHQ